MINENIYFKSGQKFVLVDSEAESLNLVAAKPFQLSWIIADKYKVLEEHDEFIYFKDLNMSADAAKITRFDQESYKKKAVAPEEVYKRFAADLFNPEYVIVGQNILNYDAYIVKNLQKLTGNPVDYSWLSRCIDTKVLFIAIQKNIKYDGEIPFLDWQYKTNAIFEKGLKSSQQFMLNHFDIPHDKEKLHDSLYDITMLYEILKKELAQFEVPDITRS